MRIGGRSTSGEESRYNSEPMKYSKAMSLDLHLTDYTRGQMVYLLPIRVYRGSVHVLDDVSTIQVTTWQIASGDSSKLIYFVKGDGCRCGLFLAWR